MARNGSGRFEPGNPGGPGRPAGVPNRATLELRTWLRGELEKPERRQRLLEHVDRDPAMHRWALEMAYGKARQGIDLDLENPTPEETEAMERLVEDRVKGALGALIRELSGKVSREDLYASLHASLSSFGAGAERLVFLDAFLDTLSPDEALAALQSCGTPTWIRPGG